MNWITRWPLASLALVAALACPVVGAAQESGQDRQSNDNQSVDRESNEDRQSADDQQADREEEQESQQVVRQLKVFELKHCRPDEVRQLISLRFDHGGAAFDNAPRPGATTVGYRGTRADDVAIAANDEAKLLFVRGPQQKIQEMEKLVQMIDVPAGEMKEQSIGAVHVIPVKEQSAREVERILGDLELDTRSVIMEDIRLFIVPSGESEENGQNLEQVKEVISRLSSRTKEEAEESSEEDSRRDGAEQEDGSQQEEASQGMN